MNTQLAERDVEAVIARTALKYDLLPYESKPFAQSQPARLAAIARMFGLDAAPMETARVLELGCASGGNIIPHAARYPKARFVGVDLARTQVASGRARIARLGLKNIEILCQSFTEIDDSLGEFDYIICHGVYSWVPDVVQDAIMRVVRARLSPVGVAYVSYNVLPGWRMLQPLRDAFLLNVPDGVDSLGRVAQARELLGFLKDASPDKGPYGDMLRAWADRLVKLPDDYVAHEFLEECNSPSTVRDFANAAGRHSLGYLGECDLSTMIVENYAPNVAEQVRGRSGNNLIETEQYLDLLSGRTFRQSLLVATERMEKVDRSLSPERLADLHFVAPAGMKIERKDKGATVTDVAGRTLTTQSPDVADALDLLIKRLPSTSSLTDLSKDKAPEVLDALYRMMIVGMVHMSTEPAVGALDAGEHPEATPLVRDDAASGSTFTTNARHETVTLDPAAQVLLPHMDGKRGRAELEKLLREAAMKGQLTYSREGAPISGRDAVKATIAEHFPQLLAGIAAAGLIQPPSA